MIVIDSRKLRAPKQTIVDHGKKVVTGD